MCKRRFCQRCQALRVFTLLLSAFLWQCSPQNNADSEWFPFSPSNTFEKGVTGMQDWLESPAGKHGFLRMQDNDLVFDDGTRVKLWGTNICSGLPYTSAAQADSFANFLAKYGMNAVRFHKFTWNGYSEYLSTELDPAKWERLDYFHSTLKEKGIYYGWSHIYGHRVLPGDSSKVLAYSEIRDLSYPWAHLNGSTSSLVNFAPDLQDLSIELTVHMLNHVNPNTGLRYADDPALAFIEFQNEDNIFWSAIERSLDQAPTYRAMLCSQFSEWLLDKYKSQANLVKAWGAENIPEGQSLEKKNIYPQPNHGLFSWEYETSLKEGREMMQHTLDKMEFLFEKQMEFYQKFEAAIRAAGYKGVLVGSCWQAGSGISHFYNLYADYAVGMIDRHNYFGGGAGGHQLDTGMVKNRSMLETPGSGLLSAGMQQVAGRPFSFSEWMSLVPSEWTAEAAPIIAVYGMGLQGWDASFSFATDIPRFSRLLESEKHGVYNATSPLHIGLYPVLARMIYRGDIREAEVLAYRNVHLPSLSEGKLGFSEKVEQGYDDKFITGNFPAELLAAGKIPVQFTSAYESSVLPEISHLFDSVNGKVLSSTGELAWYYGQQKYFTINTEFTRGIVGFSPGSPIELGEFRITTRNKFAVILLTSLDNRPLTSTSELLLVAVARARNSGMEYSDNGEKLLSRGSAPLLLEPVNLEIDLPGDARYRLQLLDHDGLPTEKYLAVKGNHLGIRGAETRTYLYRILRDK